MQRLKQQLAATIIVSALILSGCGAGVTTKTDVPTSPAARVSSSNSSVAETPATSAASSPAPVQPAPQLSQPASPVSPAPSQTAPPSPKAEVTIVSLTSPIRHGANATVVVRTSPGASCDVEVIYKSGPSTAQGLYAKTADSQGRVSWTWKVGTQTTPGSWPVIVTCSGVTSRAALVVQ